MKQKLLLALLALFTLGGSNLQAQTWSASELTDGKYVFLNVGSGRYLGPGNSWGTQASLIECSHYNTLAKVSDGVYTIESQVNNGGTAYYFSGTYMDGAAVNVTIQDNGEGIFTMSTDGSYYGYDGSTTVLANNLTDPTDANAQWKIMAYDEVYANASEENPVDLTYMILDSNFDRNNRYGGGDNNDLGNKWVMDANNQNLCGGTNENKCAESWCSAFTLSQNITVPNGYFKLRAQAALTEYTVTGADFPVVYATSGANTVTSPFNTMVNGESSMTTMSTQFTNGNYWTNYTDVITVSNKSLTIGVKGTRTDTWCIWDNFQLIYMGPIDLTEFANQLAAAVAAAQAYESQLPNAVYANIATAITENNKTYETADEYSAAIEAINNAVSTYATADIITDYSRYKAVKAAVLEAAPNTATAEADTAVEAATTTDAIDAAIATLRAALLTELPNLEIAEGGYVDVTYALVDNPSVSENTDYWTAELNGSDKTSGSWAVVNYGETEFYKNNFKFYQALALTSGTWEFGVTGFHRAGNHSTYFYAGEDKILIPGVESSVVNSMAAAKTYFDNGNGKVALKFLLEEAGNVEIGIDNQDTETDKWTIFRDFTLKYYGAPDYSVYDNRLAELATEAATYESAIPAPAYAILANVVTENNTTHANKADYLAAIEAIENAIADAQDVLTAYEAYKGSLSVRAKAVTTAALENLAAEDAETLTGIIATADAAIEECATLEALNTAISTQDANLWAGIATAIGTIELEGDETLDLTYLLTNPDLTNLANWAGAEGWYTDQEDGNSQVMTNDAATSEDGTKTKFYEYWSNPAKANNAFTLYQKVTLPKGTYNISCYAFAQDQYAGTNSVGVYFYANDTQGSAVTTTRLTEAAIDFVNEESQEVKIGLKAITGNTYNWMGIGYMELYMVSTNTTMYAINTDDVENATVVATVDGEEVTEALALKNVALTVTANEGYRVDDVTVTYVDGEETKNVDLAKTDAGYTFQMPAFDVTVNVTTVALATAEDYEALNNLINSYVFGFDENEYSPYMNIAGIKAIAAAKAIDQTVENTKQVVDEAIQAIRSAGWMGNAVEVNAFYDGYFKAQSVPSENTRPLGWQRHSTTANSADGTDTGYETRLMNLVDGITDSNRGMMTKFHAFYGEQEGYTLPLKANTTYALNFKYAGWGNTPTMHINVYSEDGTRVSQSGNFTTKDNAGDQNADSWTEYSYIFTTAEAGNYVIGLIKNTGGTEQNQAGFTDLSLYRAKSVDIKIKEGFTATTYSNENALDFSNTKGLTAYIITDANGTEAEVSSVPAGTGVYVKGEPGTYKAYILGTSNTDVSENKLVGTGNTATQLTSNETTTYYVFGRQGDPKKEAFYKVKTDKATNVSANKAYLKIDVPASEAKDVITAGGGETDGINAVEAAETLNDDIYNLQGQKVNHTTRGIYIVNGKKIVVK